jgi:hypothetical protein
MTATLPQPSDPVEKLLRRQVKLFEHAHKTPIELKGLGIAVKQQGVDTSKLYVNPAFMLLPLSECQHLSKLTPEQLSVLSAVYFARAYSEIATSESIALRYNMEVSEAVFPLYSDNYMVLFHETAEEFDHIITFRSVCQGLIGRGDVIGGEHYPHLKTVPSMFERYKGKLCANGFGGMYLLMRYILNLALKQLEGFMTAGVPEDRLSPLVKQIVAGHAEDEARHLTTSLELGLGLYRRATPKSRELIRSALRITIYSMIDRRFSGNPESTWNWETGLSVLERTLQRPEFQGFPLGIEALRDSWKQSGIAIRATPEFESSRRWLALQLRRLAGSLELQLIPQGEAFERYNGYNKIAA